MKIVNRIFRQVSFAFSDLTINFKFNLDFHWINKISFFIGFRIVSSSFLYSDDIIEN